MHVSPSARLLACGVSLCLASCNGSDARPGPTQPPVAGTDVATSGSAGGELRWQGKAAALDVRNIDGSVTASAGGGDSIEITARIVRTHEPLVLRVFASHVGGAEAVTACVAPAARPSAAHCPEADEWADHQGPVVDLVIHLPAATTLVASTVNGSVRAEGLTANVDARSVSGAIRLDTRGTIRAKTVNGSIDARIGITTWKEPMDLSTVNGSIEVDLPATTNVDLHASTVNGTVSTTRPLTEARVASTEIDGHLGTGGSELRLRTVNGRIKVR